MEEEYGVGIPEYWDDEDIKKFCERFAERDYRKEIDKIKEVLKNVGR